ncbi:MAG: integration host factor subunit beta [Succinivibrio sp.]|nr:integration host factor subunit beta [Succinivibrio sp.]
MTRSELIASLQKSCQGLQPGNVEQIVLEIIEQMCLSLEHGERIEIRGFGSFEIRTRNPRIAHNPKTGEQVDLGTRKVAHFKPGIALRARVNGSQTAS